MTSPWLGGTDFDGDGLTDGQEIHGTHTNPRLPDSDGERMSDYQETQIAPNHLRPDLSDLIAKPTGIEVVPKPGMDFTAAFSESPATAHQDGGHSTSSGDHPADHGWQQPVDHATQLEARYHGADPPPAAEQTVDHITQLGLQLHPTDHMTRGEGSADQPPFGSGAIIPTADPTEIPPHAVHIEADTHAVHPPHPPVTAEVAEQAGRVERDAAVEQVEQVAHADQGPTVNEHQHTDAIG